MALNATFSAEFKNACFSSGFSSLMDGGIVCVYEGAQPASPDVAITDQVLLATNQLSATALGSPVNGSADFNSIGQEMSVDHDGYASFYRIFKADGTTGVHDGTAGTGGTNMVITNTNHLVEGAKFTISSWSIVVG
jgi:hypothetical protein